ncbi:YezD family protein [Methylocaldum szegediense]|uniref:DUF2292 domain-containing protein n=1 Tax=Methylocaldum szegediense TaxID=73780 RepID=A0ABN8X8J1_9GAMM|nr:DUF2292 domain-containing protein [Methylocaldum szegediense]CAI8897915.1 conserved protein of unknown function [Methylocaldum szegediense]
MSLKNRLPHQTPETWLTVQKILEALHGLRFGGVEIVVHDGRIVQIERKEKLRLNIPCPNETAESVKLDDVI